MLHKAPAYHVGEIHDLEICTLGHTLGHALITPAVSGGRHIFFLAFGIEVVVQVSLLCIRHDAPILLTPLGAPFFIRDDVVADIQVVLELSTLAACSDHTPFIIAGNISSSQMIYAFNCSKALSIPRLDWKSYSSFRMAHVAAQDQKLCDAARTALVSQTKLSISRSNHI